MRTTESFGSKPLHVGKSSCKFSNRLNATKFDANSVCRGESQHARQVIHGHCPSVH
jgi:hypothetical protein